VTQRRRALSFESFDQVNADVAGLLSGHETVGQWTLGQILHHLATGIAGTMRSAPGPTIELDLQAEQALAVSRERFFQAGRFPDGMQAPHPALIPPPDAEPIAQSARLRQRIDRFAQYAGPLGSHPRLGRLSHEEWTQFHLIHCAHHLGFAHPI
jgi:hypothetical protein